MGGLVAAPLVANSDGLGKTYGVKQKFIDAIILRMGDFSLSLQPAVIAALADFYEIVNGHNPLLHLVAPCTAEEFAVRHVLESLMLLGYLPEGSLFADVGAGAGLPSIPCLMARGDLRATLIESKQKKARYLEDAARRLGISARVKIINTQFAEGDAGKCGFVTCRALDKFSQHLPKLIRWSGKRGMLFFGGDGLGEILAKTGRKFEKISIPFSERRYLYIIDAGRAE